MNFFEDILKSNGGAFAVVIAILGLAFWVVNKISVIVANHGSFTSNMTDIKNDVKTINTDIAYLKGTFNAIQAASNPLTQRQSPVSLTAQGKEVAERIGVYNMVANNWESIYMNLQRDLDSKNAYDIQQFCIDKATADLSYFISSSDIEIVKLDAFKSGLFLAQYGAMFGIIIRDKYFEMEKIPLVDIDTHDPEATK